MASQPHYPHERLADTLNLEYVHLDLKSHLAGVAMAVTVNETESMNANTALRIRQAMQGDVPAGWIDASQDEYETRVADLELFHEMYDRTTAEVHRQFVADPTLNVNVHYASQKALADVKALVKRERKEEGMPRAEYKRQLDFARYIANLYGEEQTLHYREFQA